MNAILKGLLIVSTIVNTWFAIAASDSVIRIRSIEELRELAARDGVTVKMEPGVYRLDDADDHHFIRFTGDGSHYDLSGVTFEIDNKLFSKFGVVPGKDGFYCVIDLIGDDIVFEGLTTRNVGPEASVQSRNKIFNVVGSNVELRNVDITTSGSSPWGYGSLYGLGGGDVRKMNGIRVGWPAKNSKLIGCHVHMRAMGHAIFVQGAEDTLIEDCHVDGLLRPTNEILLENSGYAYDRDFKARTGTYVEGVYVGLEGEILPDEMLALSEDGIRMYGHGGENNHPTGATTVRNCTVRKMRRGICTGLGPGADVVINCEVTECAAAGFNIGDGDTLENCRADAKYAEALSCPYYGSRNAKVELEILDSRNGLANTVLATVNGKGHDIKLSTAKSDFLPKDFTIEVATNKGYAFYQKKRGEPFAEEIVLENTTPAMVVKP
ncbi:hypothetical protein QEH56_24175 [Pelagicoccus enzymogenes]|uniref:hypothetical protein n=1 Tax=Pelagicoccus enzymogenes TaxID=2773457 RepID=UPI00280DADDB|nr:hypothetical protein [Pelagicoccus enzymogenes]MDQ8201279.1 hypothetical protein [Pelagicoccus enzymogenes]